MSSGRPKAADMTALALRMGAVSGATREAYRSVVWMLACPRRVCTSRIGTPQDTHQEAAEWRTAAWAMGWSGYIPGC